MTSESQIENLTEQFREGDDAPLADLIAHYQQRLKRIVRFRLDYRLGGRVSDSDVLQECYVRAISRLENYLSNPVQG